MQDDLYANDLHFYNSIQIIHIIANRLHIEYTQYMRASAKEVIQEAGLRTTPARIAILELFSEDCDPRSADQLHASLGRKAPDLVTVYRTLESFVQAGILRRIDLQTGSTQYEPAGHHHHHIVCTGCGAVESFEACGVSRLSQKVIQDSVKFKTIDSHALEFFGTCKICARI